ncbi:hypothetical protein HLI18_33805 [Rhizobium laguerreae]|uniref:hypothetical protein n=1 Tax=Rhizobium laguerreae TaxID=1076926 RepID=UPI001478F4C3|nr:hypothetical protein [Rhizobium laguerreae]NNG74708.1 hypothetical protein [Rhizobium laguerreae]
MKPFRVRFLDRAPKEVRGDFIIRSGPYSGKTVDFMLTPSTMREAEMTNQFFEKNLPKFTETLLDHTNKADIIPLDMRFLSKGNQEMLMNAVRSLSASQQAKLILVR